MITRCVGRTSRLRIELLVSGVMSASPGIGGRTARPPTLRNTWSAVICSPPTFIVRGPVNRAWPRIRVQPVIPSIHDARPSRRASTTASCRALTRARSMPTAPSSTTPNSAARRAMWAASALATRVLVGVQPVLTQVPPSLSRSTSTTLRPASARRPASAGPAWPAPTIRASTCRPAPGPPTVGEGLWAGMLHPHDLTLRQHRPRRRAAPTDIVPPIRTPPENHGAATAPIIVSGRRPGSYGNPPMVTCGRGGIGRRAGLKIRFRKECRFEPDRPHQIKSASRWPFRFPADADRRLAARGAARPEASSPSLRPPWRSALAAPHAWRGRRRAGRRSRTVGPQP